jgi:hypothetical protein
MPFHSTILDDCRIATPCPASWDRMIGDDRVRFCQECQLNVYDISHLTRREAEALLSAAEGRICARIHRRADGTILTRDCPVGLRALRRRISQRAAAVFASLVSLCSIAVGQNQQREPTEAPMKITLTQGECKLQGATLAGTVLDINGAPVTNARITVRRIERRRAREVRYADTDDRGLFELAGLRPGTYGVAIDAPGFTRQEIKTVILQKDQIATLPVVLKASRERLLLGRMSPRPKSTERDLECPLSKQ